MNCIDALIALKLGNRIIDGELVPNNIYLELREDKIIEVNAENGSEREVHFPVVGKGLFNDRWINYEDAKPFIEEKQRLVEHYYYHMDEIKNKASKALLKNELKLVSNNN